MNWEVADKYAVMDTFFQELFTAQPAYQDMFSYKGIALDSLRANSDYRGSCSFLIAYLDDAAAGKADAEGLAIRHGPRKIGAADFKIAKAALVKACSDHGIQDLGGVIDEILKYV